MHSDPPDRVTRWPLAAAFIAAIVLCALGLAAVPIAETAAPAPQEIPRVWDEAALREFQLPPPGTDIRSEHVPSDYYYALPERPIYRTYPVYAPGHEPPGYLDSLRTLEPEILLDTDTLDTEAEWIHAGEAVFDTPETYLLTTGPFSPAGLVRGGVPMAADGTLPFHRYVVVAKGDVRVGVGACSNCHLRVMPDGSALKAVQGNYPLDGRESKGVLVAITDVGR